MSILERSDNELIVNALKMWSNYIETHDVNLSAKDLLERNLSNKINILSEEQVLLVNKLKSLASTYLSTSKLENNEKDINKNFTLTMDQKLAYVNIKAWMGKDESYFVLKGSAGSGKSYLLYLLSKLTQYQIYFTAPTNQATKILKKNVDKYAKTIYSLLGLRMVQDEDELVMDYGKKLPHFSKRSIIVIDECSMLSKKLVDFIDKVVKDYGVKVLYVGDPYQLNPVGERRSKSFKMAKRYYINTLRKIVRYDSQLLNLTRKIKKCIRHKDYRSPILNNYDDNKGVVVLKSQLQFIDRLKTFKEPKDFENVKVIAWRNKTVNKYNDIIRNNLGFTNRFEIGDIILLADPVIEDDRIIAAIDDQFEIIGINKTSVNIPNRKIPIKVYNLTLKGDINININVPRHQEKYEAFLKNRASMASKLRDDDRREAWAEYYRIKQKFNNVRYSYAITTHRVQGQTIHSSFVDQQDILCNENKLEAFRSLMVACSRPTTWLYTF